MSWKKLKNNNKNLIFKKILNIKKDSCVDKLSGKCLKPIIIQNCIDCNINLIFKIKLQKLNFKLLNKLKKGTGGVC